MAADKLYVVHKDGAAYRLYKYRPGESAPSDDYEVDEDGRCSCPGFRFRKNCRHVQFLKTIDSPATMECFKEDALDRADRVIAALGESILGAHTDLEFDPDDGQVAKITVTCESRVPLDEPLLMRGRVDEVPVDVIIE